MLKNIAEIHLENLNLYLKNIKKEVCNVGTLRKSSPKIVKVREIAIVTRAEALLSLSSFLSQVADLMDEYGEIFGSEHYRDWLKHKKKDHEKLDWDTIVRSPVPASARNDLPHPETQVKKTC